MQDQAQKILKERFELFKTNVEHEIKHLGAYLSKEIKSDDTKYQKINKVLENALNELNKLL